MRTRQRGALILLGLLTLALGSAVVLTPARQSAVALSATNACKSNATGTWSDIAIGLTGTATPSSATVGVDTITLGGVNFQADVPATLLISGYNLGLLTVGANSIPVKGWVGLAGSNTAEGVQVLQFTATVNTTITDPNGLPGTGDETATPLALNLGLGTTTWTPTGGNVAFAQAVPGSLPAIPAGQVAAGAVTPLGGVYISAQVAGGLIKANFDCQGGTSAVGGASFTPATPGAFATVTVGSGSTTTPQPTSTTVSGSSTTTAPASTSSPATTTTAPPTSGSTVYATSCKNSVTPDVSTLDFDATGTLPGQVTADSVFAATKMKWKVTIPASVFQTGINLGLLTPGVSITGTLDLAIAATNTQQATQDAPKITLTVPVAVGGDGLALPSTVAFDVPDMTWTARSGRIDMSMLGANVAVKLAPTLQVSFVCKPTTSAAFVSTTASGTSTATSTTGPTTTAAATTTTQAATTTTLPATTTTLPPPTNGSATYATSCKNSVTPDLSTLNFDATGTLPGQVTADAAFSLTKMKWKVTIPASVFQTGINLGLVTPGVPITGTLDLAITSTNTQQTTQDSPKLPLSVPVTAGADGLALPSTVAFDVPDMTWTARSGKIDMAMYGANVTVKLTPTLQVVFVCKPTTTGPFVSTNAVGVSTATTSTTTTVRVASGAVVPTSTTVAAQSLVRTGPSGSIVVQVLAALVFLDLGYLALSLRRSPRRRHSY